MSAFTISLFLSIMGMAQLALGMDRHHRQFWEHAATEASLKRYRRSGWGFLLTALAPCLIDWGWAIGLIAWSGALTTAQICVTLLLAATRPR